jgi:hypothetical protein
MNNLLLIVALKCLPLPIGLFFGFYDYTGIWLIPVLEWIVKENAVNKKGLHRLENLAVLRQSGYILKFERISI